MDLPEEQIEAMEQMGVFDSTTILLTTALSGVLFLLYLIWIRKYFVAGALKKPALAETS